MNTQLPPNISSFVIRFVVEPAESAQAAKISRGAIRHIQTDEEISFSNWEEAVTFIQRFVPLENSSE